MTRKFDSVFLLVISMLVATSSIADDYNYEIGLAFERESFDGFSLITTTSGLITNRGSSETDSTSLMGSWYFSGLSDDDGPRARAVLVDRASSLSVRIGRTDSSVSTFFASTDPAFPLGPFDTQFNSEIDYYGANLRYVDKDSGWFGSLGFLESDESFSGLFGSSFDATGWSIGLGKYVFENTTVTLDYGRVDSSLGGNSTVIGISAEHLGDLGQQWQYGIDLGFSHGDADGGPDQDIWRGAFSLYPNRDFEFGLAVDHVDGGSIGLDNTSYEGFASWFVRPNVRLSASYKTDDSDFLGTVFIPSATSEDSLDRDAFELGISVRF